MKEEKWEKWMQKENGTGRNGPLMRNPVFSKTKSSTHSAIPAC